MELITKEIGESFVLSVNSPRLSQELLGSLDMRVRDFANDKKLALDFACVGWVCAEFLNFLKVNAARREICLINLSSEIFTLLNLTRHDGFARIYLSESDFLDDKRQLVNRRFSVC